MALMILPSTQDARVPYTEADTVLSFSQCGKVDLEKKGSSQPGVADGNQLFRTWPCELSECAMANVHFRGH